MSDSLTTLFESVFAGFMESLSPAVDQIFYEYEANVSSGKFSDADLRGQLEQMLSFFPRSHHLYPGLVKNVSAFAATDPTAILTNLCSKFKSETTRGPEGSPVLMLVTTLSFDRTNQHHFQFQRYLNLIILSDVIFRIFTDYPARQAITKMVSCGYNLCQDSNGFPVLQDLLLDTWALIFYHLSGTTLGDIAMAYEQYIDDSNAPKVFRLISCVQGNQEFADSLLMSLHAMKKRRALVAEVFSWLSVLLAQIDCDNSCLNEFFKLAWESKSVHGLKEGAIDLITTLFNRIPSQAKKSHGFFTAHIYKHVGRPEKVERTARAFLRLIRGDTSHVFEAYDGTDVLACVGCSGSLAKDQSAPDSFTSTFMKVYFPKAQFDKCRTVFRDILIHLAALDINEFTKNVLPKFLQLETSDDRFLVLLMAIPYINMPEFIKRSYCQATAKQIKAFNAATRDVIWRLIPMLKEVVATQKYVVVNDSFQLQAALDEADQLVSDFLQVNNCHVFQLEPKSNNMPIRGGDPNNLVLHVLRCLPHAFTDEDLKKEEVINLILSFAVNDNHLLATRAVEVIVAVYSKSDFREVFIRGCLKVVLNLRARKELRARSLQLLYHAIITHNESISSELLRDVEAAMVFQLGNAWAFSRATSLRLLKHLAAIGYSPAYLQLAENVTAICDSVKRSILVADVPPKPAMMQVPVGHLTIDMLCNSRYNGLWLITYSEILNVLIQTNQIELLTKIRELVEPWIAVCGEMLEKKEISAFSAATLHLIYLDTFGPDVPVPENEEEEVICEADCCRVPTELFQRILSSGSLEAKKVLVNAMCFVNWRIIPFVLSLVLTAESTLYPDIAWALSFIIQNPANFNHIIRDIFRQFVEFLSVLQTHFSRLGVNSARDIKWTQEVQNRIKENESLCVNYCILISAAFNNIQDQVPEEEWPVSYRQVLVQFLIHWSELPENSDFDKLKAYALNALIPIIHAGTVFSNGFSFSLSMLDMMLKCQLNGYPVLDALLMFHVDILMNEFVRQVFLRPKRESQLFLDAILAALENCDELAFLLPHVGSLVLLAMHCVAEDIDSGKFILTKVAVLFLNQSPDGQIVKTIEESEDFSFAPNLCQFATEQLIDAALDILKDCTKLFVVKNLVEMLKPWFAKLRLLPTHNFIIQGVPTKYRKFTVISFFEAMFAVSSCLSGDLHGAFAELWCELLQSADNNVVVLVCLFESEETEAKEKIFGELLEKDPALISKYLAKRCTFAYWYFMRSQRQQSPSSIHWMLHVLTRAFIDYVDYAAPSFTVALHYAMLFVEESRGLFEATVSVFGLDPSEGNLIWTREPYSDELRAVSVVSELCEMLTEQSPQAIEKWALEATRWAVGCCDITTAYRSLVILNSLHAQIMPSFVQLLVNAVLYHLSRVTDDHCREVALYVGECFKVLYQHIENADVANFAFPFASAFLHCPAFQENCLASAMPIFRQCVDHPVLGKSAKQILVDAFLPFARQLETSQEAQQLLIDITNIIEAPELHMLAAAFLVKPLPFAHIEKTMPEIMALNLNVDQLKRTFVFFQSMLKGASRPLADSILSVATELLKKYEKKIDRDSLAPVFAFALKRIAVFQSAIDFLQVITRVDHTVATHRNTSPPHEKTLEDVKKQIMDVLKASVAPEPVPITNCKKLSELQGMVDQKNSPKIYPFATQYEMFLGLKKESSKKVNQMDSGQKRFTSTMSLASGMIMSNRSLGVTRALHNITLDKLDLAPLSKKVVYQQALDLPSADDGAWKFVVTPQEFVSLDDDDEESSAPTPY